MKQFDFLLALSFTFQAPNNRALNQNYYVLIQPLFPDNIFYQNLSLFFVKVVFRWKEKCLSLAFSNFILRKSYTFLLRIYYVEILIIHFDEKLCRYRVYGFSRDRIFTVLFKHLLYWAWKEKSRHTIKGKPLLCFSAVDDITVVILGTNRNYQISF